MPLRGLRREQEPWAAATAPSARYEAQGFDYRNVAENARGRCSCLRRKQETRA
jgi:hypothetical protein